jgi:hypothetical protein
MCETFRVDRFLVPARAGEEFLGKVHATHEILRKQPGFVRDAILEQSSGPGEFNFVTIVEWENSDFFQGAHQAVAAPHRKMNFDPHELITRLGIRADIANYKRVKRAMAAEYNEELHANFGPEDWGVAGCEIEEKSVAGGNGSQILGY